MSEPSLLSSITDLFRYRRPRPIDRLMRPLRDFFRHKLAGAGLLMGATAIAVIWANSPWEHNYHELLDTHLGFGLGDWHLSKTVHHWINDGLMGIFFFLVGLEIKRELLVGELSSRRKAMLPAVAAVGGMLAPALIYVALNPSGPGTRGWGVPMATDIAFALGVLALLGDRVPIGLKVFLTALAIVDDIGAVLVIAVFYTEEIALVSLGAGLAVLVLAAVVNRLQVQSPAPYILLGALCWLAFLQSGVHATIAALLIAMTIPSRTRIDGNELVDGMKTLLGRLDEIGAPGGTAMNTSEQQHIIDRMAATAIDASAPLQRIEHALAGPVTFLVLPIFALANAGVTLHGGLGAEIANPVSLGIILGLFLGKPIGIGLFSYGAVKLGMADLPKQVTWRQVVGVGLLGGIGFTMALFVAGLAFPDPAGLETAKVGILAASIISGVIGWLLVRAVTRGVHHES